MPIPSPIGSDSEPSSPVPPPPPPHLQATQQYPPPPRSTCQRWFTPDPCPFEHAIAVIPFTPVQVRVLHHRYMPLIRSLRTRSTRVAFAFHTCRTIITVGSLIVPALLSIQYTGATSTGETELSRQIYWGTWVISLFVTMCNGLLTLFKLDKKYYFIHTTLEQLITEGWQYIELTGRYSGFHTRGRKPTHANQFKYFCHAVEKIRMIQVQEEYYKLTDMHTQQAQTQQPTQPQVPPQGNELPPPVQASSKMNVPPSYTQNQVVASVGSSILPMSPLKDDIRNLPREIYEEVEEQISRSQIDGEIARTGAPRREGVGQSPAPNTQSSTDREAASVPV